jgi:hypothetical protein
MAVPGLLVVTAGNIVCFWLEARQLIGEVPADQLAAARWPYGWVQGVDSRFGGSCPPSRWQPSTVQEPRSVCTAEMATHQSAARSVQEVLNPTHRAQYPIRTAEMVTHRTADGWWVRDVPLGGSIPSPAQQPPSPIRTAEMVTRRTADGWWIREEQFGGSVGVPNPTHEPRSPIRPPEIVTNQYPANSNDRPSRTTPDLAEFFANLLRQPSTPEDRG